MSFTDDIKALQRRVGASPDGIIGERTLDAINRALDAAAPSERPAQPKPQPPTAPPQTKRKINTIAVHCSATPEGKPFTAADIDQWHRKQGWSEIGYNAVVLLDGTIQRGRDEAKTPSHAMGHNSDSIAICYIGGVGTDGKPKDTRTAAQKAALLTWLELKKQQFPNAKILGHHDYPGVTKACPSFPAAKEYAGL